MLLSSAETKPCVKPLHQQVLRLLIQSDTLAKPIRAKDTDCNSSRWTQLAA